MKRLYKKNYVFGVDDGADYFDRVVWLIDFVGLSLVPNRVVSVLDREGIRADAVGD